MCELNRGPMRNIGTAYEPIDPAILGLTARYGHDPEALLPIFQELQTRHGGLTDKIVSDVARSLGIATAQAQGVASFYALLSTSMRSPHTLRICDSPPCWLRGAAQVQATAEQTLGAAWAVERTSCLGLCDRAPAALVDEEPCGPWVAVDWDTALDIVARALVQVRQASGPDAIGVLASAKCTNEENYLMQKFARQVLGTHHIDHCARLCHASTIAGLHMSLGSGAMSNTMQDIVEQAQALFIIGSNTTEQHPVFGTMIRQAVRTRGVKLVVADPRAIDITEFATLHLRQRPGTDVVLLNGLVHIILQRGWHDQAFIEARTEGFDDFRRTVERYPPALVSEITGVAVDDLQRAAELLAVHKPMAVIWAMGITQHTTGVLNVLSLANLQLLLGNLGVAGGGVNPLRGQNNVQGSCDMGALPDFLPGYQLVTDAATPSAPIGTGAVWWGHRHGVKF